MTVFTPGQRWVSDSESELGLGTPTSGYWLFSSLPAERLAITRCVMRL